jgi:hypothetical protein
MGVNMDGGMHAAAGVLHGTCGNMGEGVPSALQTGCVVLEMVPAMCFQ